MQTYTIYKKDNAISGEITLHPSKNISNRDITIRALKNAKLDIRTIGEKETAKVFDDSLREGMIPLDKGEPAKAIRFLRAFLWYFKGEWIVTGSAEMRKRPVGDVIELLQNEGINIKYIERDGYPPLKIIGKGMKGNITRVDAVICSQFINTSLLLSTAVPVDSVEELKNRIISSPYVDQTIRLLRYLGVNTNWDKSEVLIEHEVRASSDITIEADWLAASYWYQMAAISSDATLAINGLNPFSVQSYAIVKDIFEPLGVRTVNTPTGVVINKIPVKLKRFDFDLSVSSQLLPTMVATCVALGMPFKISGIEALKSNDPDRIMALQSQYVKLGAKLTIAKKGIHETLNFDGKSNFPQKGEILFTSFDDHRMVMSLAPLALMGIDVVIENPRVVSKSYPGFWDDLKKAGFEVK